ncbi:MmcQ/YjbR family DNA-binding protein [Acidisphaera sp. L21]|uniref:MmcQ/YjbR family DNA-binding protein n=1 Tax=Acidisphaera sp. L21 TaxID=1641851 RepID=UPI0020B13F0C|nr:MmcQ/YjbR family DNA-binding protein [Acidisphaera sp. L21]
MQACRFTPSPTALPSGMLGHMPPIDRLRPICLALPDATERETWEAPNFRVREKIFAMVSHRDGRPAVWLKAPPGSQRILVTTDPARFFAPPYLGPKGWVAMWLDQKPDWAEVESLVRRSYRLVAPKRLAARIDAPG